MRRQKDETEYISNMRMYAPLPHHALCVCGQGLGMSPVPNKGGTLSLCCNVHCYAPCGMGYTTCLGEHRCNKSSRELEKPIVKLCFMSIKRKLLEKLRI